MIFLAILCALAGSAFLGYGITLAFSWWLSRPRIGEEPTRSVEVDLLAPDPFVDGLPCSACNHYQPFGYRKLHCYSCGAELPGAVVDAEPTWPGGGEAA